MSDQRTVPEWRPDMTRAERKEYRKAHQQASVERSRRKTQEIRDRVGPGCYYGCFTLFGIAALATAIAACPPG